jgi:hypothetical protein
LPFEKGLKLAGVPLNTPIVFCVFNRPSPTRTVFQAIAKARPLRLLLVADGPREDRPGEGNLCREVREIIQRVDWPCEVSANFADRNLGCRERIISGLNWAFDLVEEAIILEDDCLPHPSFFPFCQELVERYREDSRVAMISGDNFVGKPLPNGYSYYFSRMTHIWGWATWRRSWARYDRHLRDWPEIRSANLLAEVFDDPRLVRYWTARFDEMHDDTGPDTWDYQWTYTNLVNNVLCITPRVNMVTNIGFGKEATHTVNPDKRMILEAHPIDQPLRHPPCLIPLRSMDRISQQFVLQPSLQVRVLRRLYRRVHR